MNAQTSLLAYLFPFFFYLLLRRLGALESLVVGFLSGVIFGYFAYQWLTVFEDITPFYLAVFFNGVLISFIFLISSLLFRKYPKNLFVHLFSFGFALFIIRAAFHYAPVLNYAKAFMAVTNNQTIFDWLTPYFGSSIIDVLVLAMGCLVAQLWLRRKDGMLSTGLLKFLIFFVILIIVNNSLSLRNYSDAGRETTRIALLQGDFDKSWDQRVALAMDMIEYYSNQTLVAASKGAKIVVWPEYAILKDLIHVDTDLSDKLAQMSRKTGASIVAGSFELIDQTKPSDFKNKHDLSLVYDPEKALLEPYRAVHPIFKDTVPGTKKIIFSTQNSSFPVISCFEVANHGFVLDYLSNATEQVDYLITIANIQLFERNEGTARITNHIRRLTMESGKYFVYVSNTGPSFVLDPRGDFKLYIPIGKRSTELYDVPKIREVSFYSKYQELPLMILFLVGFALSLRNKSNKHLTKGV